MPNDSHTESGVRLRHAVRWFVRRYYPRLEISDAEHVPQDGPVLLCANHANSLLDPVLVGIAARRPVRFLAKAPLFQMPVLGRLMHALGMIPAFRGSDDSRHVRHNLESLESGAQALADGKAMGIFPEGKSHDAQRVEMVRSGAARMAVMAAENGAKTLKVVPLALNYEQKERFRSAVWIRVGEPIDVAAWIEQHDGDPRRATRALTAELDARLKQLVVHVDQPQWEPYLEDLEVLVPPRREFAGRPLHLRKRIADAMNYFLTHERERAESLAERIDEYRQAVADAGLEVDSPVLRQPAWRTSLTLIWRLVWLVLLAIPASVGTLHHIVPFVVVRGIAARITRPGRTTVSLNRLALGLPIYGLWYAIVGWWMFGYFATWIAVTWMTAAPFAGLVSLHYWRVAGQSRRLLWHQFVVLLRRRQLRRLREAQQSVYEPLLTMVEEYARKVPRPEPVESGPSRAALARRAARYAIVAVVLSLAAWFVRSWIADEGTIAIGGGPNLAELGPDRLDARLDADERSLRDIIRGLGQLEDRAIEIRDDFAAGRRMYANQADNDAVRQLLLSYLNYRAALIRLLWEYLHHEDVEDERLRLRCFLAEFTAAALLYDSSMKFVHKFNRSPETVKRLNEGEPVWHIPPGVYDMIDRNLANRQNVELFETAQRYYAAQRDRMEALNLGDGSPYQSFHESIERSHKTIDELGGPVWQRRVVVAARGLKSLLSRVQYETQSVVSTWIGDVKIREPRSHTGLIEPAHLEQLRTRLRPGDILLERRNWYLSNAFLPGYWPHAALYVGTADDLKQLGLHQDPAVQAHWDEYTAKDREGHEHVIIEALSEGVVFNSLEHSMGLADSVAVLRPRVDQDKVAAAIRRAFRHSGKPYDFEFDFSSTDKLVCTEVVFRSYGGNAGPIDFPLVEIMGRQTMPAIELVRKYADEREDENRQFDFVAFVDGDEAAGTSRLADEAAFLETLDRPALTWLQQLDRAEKRSLPPLRPLGWIVLTLTAASLAGFLVFKRRTGQSA